MGTAASTASSPRTSPERRVRRAAAAAGAVAKALQHARGRLSDEEAAEDAPAEENTRTLPTALKRQIKRTVSKETDEFHAAALPSLAPEALALLKRVTRERQLAFHHIDSFVDYCEISGDFELTPDLLALFRSFHVHIKSAVLQRDLCTGSELGLRVVLADFGLLTMMFALSSAAGTGLLRAYLEHNLAMIYDLPREAVVVGSWLPGSVALQCVFEACAVRWDPDAKQQLAQAFEARVRLARAGVSVFAAAADDRLARSLPVSYAVYVIQRAWRGRPRQLQRRHVRQRQLSADDTDETKDPADQRGGQGARGGGAGGRPAVLLPAERFTRGATPLHSMRPAAERSFGAMVKNALEPWWRQLELAQGAGLVGEDLGCFGREMAKLVNAYEHTFVSVGGTDTSVRGAQWVAPTAEALARAGLPLAHGTTAGGGGDVVDEFSDIVGEGLQSAHGLHPIGPTTLVLRLRLQGLAAVLRRDLFDAHFDCIVEAAARHIAGVPTAVPVHVLAKRYGSVVVFVGIETETTGLASAVAAPLR